MTDSHLVRAQLEALAEGEVDGPTREAYIDHLSRCDRCFGAFDEEWEIRLPGGVRVEEVVAEISGEMPSEIAERIEREILSKVRLADLVSDAAWFATSGFLKVVEGLLRPLVGLERSRERPEEVEN